MAARGHWRFTNAPLFRFSVSRQRRDTRLRRGRACELAGCPSPRRPDRQTDGTLHSRRPRLAGMAHPGDGGEPQACVERAIPRTIEICGSTTHANLPANQRSGPDRALYRRRSRLAPDSVLELVDAAVAVSLGLLYAWRQFSDEATSE